MSTKKSLCKKPRSKKNEILILAMRSISRPDLNSLHQRNDSGSMESSAKQRTDATSGAGGGWEGGWLERRRKG
jgi:hypothetical protein